MSVFVPVPYCFDDCGFVVEPEVSWFLFIEFLSLFWIIYPCFFSSLIIVDVVPGTVNFTLWATGYFLYSCRYSYLRSGMQLNYSVLFGLSIPYF